MCWELLLFPSQKGGDVCDLLFVKQELQSACFPIFKLTDVILNKEEDDISPAEDINDGPLCFYDVLADYFVSVSESGKPILDLIVQLWSQSFASHIFALLFHKWVCKFVSAFVLFRS